MSRTKTIDLLHESLFSDDVSHLTPTMQKLRARCNGAFTILLDKPTTSDQEIIRYLMANHGISERQAYRDIEAIKYQLGNVKNAAKEWQRYKLIHMIDEAYEMAKSEKDVKAMAQIIGQFGKYTQLDQADAKDMPWDEIVPQPFEPTGDPTVLGLKPIPNLREKIDKLKKKYLEMIDIEDVSYGPGGTGGD
jgi:hypothetical protein